jgi:hypothetical protein
MIRTPRKRLHNYQHWWKHIEASCQAQCLVRRKLSWRSSVTTPSASHNEVQAGRSAREDQLEASSEPRLRIATRTVHTALQTPLYIDITRKTSGRSHLPTPLGRAESPHYVLGCLWDSRSRAGTTRCCGSPSKDLGIEIGTAVCHSRFPQTQPRQIGPVSRRTVPVSGFRRKTPGSDSSPQMRQLSGSRPDRPAYCKKNGQTSKSTISHMRKA